MHGGQIMKRQCNSKLPAERRIWVPQKRNLDGIPMNIYEENSACNFRVQNECKWTLPQWPTTFSIADIVLLSHLLALGAKLFTGMKNSSSLKLQF